MYIPLILAPLFGVGLHPKGKIGIVYSLGHWSTFELVNIQWKNHFSWEVFTQLLYGNPSKVSNLVDTLSYKL